MQVTYTLTGEYLFHKNWKNEYITKYAVHTGISRTLNKFEKINTFGRQWDSHIPLIIIFFIVIERKKTLVG